MGLLDGDIAAIINDALTGIFLNATLTRDIPEFTSSPDASDPFDPQPGLVVSTEYTCKAIEEIYFEDTDTAGFATRRMRRLIILTNSLSITPTANDRVTISGREGTFTILDVAADPARATWTCSEKT